MLREKLEKIKNFVRSKTGEAIILVAMATVSLLFTIIFYSIKLNDGNVDAEGNIASLWSVDMMTYGKYFLRGANTYLIVAFFVVLALVVVAAVISFLKRNNVVYYAVAVYNFILDVVLIVFHFIFSIFQTSAIFLIILNILVSALSLVLLLMWRRRNQAESLQDAEAELSFDGASSLSHKTFRLIMLVCESVATIAMFCTLFMPVYPQSGQLYSLFETFAYSSLPLYLHIAFLVVFVGCIVGLLSFISTLAYYKSREFCRKSKSYIYGVMFFTLAFFIAEYVVTFVLSISKSNDVSELATAGKIVSFIPFMIVLASLLVHSIFTGKCAIYIDGQKDVKSLSLKVEPLIYVGLMTVGLFTSLILNIINVKTTIQSSEVASINLTGAKLLTDYPDLAGGFQLIAFLLIAILITSSMMLIMSLFSLLSKNKDYYGIVKTSAFTNLVFSLLIGLFGMYFKVAQQINEENINSLLEHYNLENYINYSYELTSQSIFVLVICGVIFGIMLFRKQFNLAVVQTEFEMTIKNPQDGLASTADHSVAAGQPLSQDGDIMVSDFDVCPAFTELDGKLPQFKAELEVRRQKLFDNFTLPNLVRFIVDYARECRLHLSYSLEDIATFVAGLGASRLTILQGMSGTGKTSLPKIFAEAIMGECEIVEVESSWRDKNELLGYYNEFSKCYTPKKFTQCLYKARLNSSALTFIVLDEMNLSRIEYYFSDFLSLMEHEPDKREIKLLNIKLHRFEDGKQVSYQGLTDGHTIKIPQNVWFIGTANRDESTFAISDKVYDRAQTMNFNKRAPKIHSFSEPLAQRFASYDMFIKLFEEAKANVSFDAEENAIVQKVEKILAPYNISFGNRILKQMEDFVKIYCACFGDRDAVLKEAVEKILLSKVVSKLENKVVENKDALAAEFERLGLAACSDFVSKLNED